MIVQGLACKLGGSAQFDTNELKIIVNPRAAVGLVTDDTQTQHVNQADLMSEDHVSQSNIDAEGYRSKTTPKRA